VTVELVDHIEDSPTLKRLEPDCIFHTNSGTDKACDWDFTDGISFTIDGRYYIIFARNDISEGLIAHECFHAMGQICMDIGIKYDAENDEPMAYILQWLVDEVYRTITKDKASK
jgi:hypothetical protein